MRLPMLTSQKVVRILKKIGFQEARQTGSHLILSIIKQTGLTNQDFLKLLK